MPPTPPSRRRSRGGVEGTGLPGPPRPEGVGGPQYGVRWQPRLPHEVLRALGLEGARGSTPLLGDARGWQGREALDSYVFLYLYSYIFLYINTLTNSYPIPTFKGWVVPAPLTAVLSKQYPWGCRLVTPWMALYPTYTYI